MTNTNTSRIIAVISLLTIPAACFWLPDILIHALRGQNFRGTDALVLSGILAMITYLVCIRLSKTNLKIRGLRPAAMLTGIGIWEFGPLCMTLGASFSGGGFTKPSGGAAVELGMIFPPFTYIMSAYDGTLLALLVVTGGLVWAFVRDQRDNIGTEVAT